MWQPVFRPSRCLVVCLFLGCAALGDDLDGKTLPYVLTRALPRHALHSHRLVVTQPRTGERVEMTSPLATDLVEFLRDRE